VTENAKDKVSWLGFLQGEMDLALTDMFFFKKEMFQGGNSVHSGAPTCIYLKAVLK
jgi:hypothetical protein